MAEISLPHNWRPRIYQRGLWVYLEDGGKRAYMIAHRRWGKDDVVLHYTACAAMQRPGNYWYMLPEASQARKAIWDAVDPHSGKRRVDGAFPALIRKKTVDHEMKIEFVNGALWQVVGSDNYDSLIGAPPVGIIFSEWALADPQAWAYLQPILEENDGWALFITTPRGRNHAASFYDMAATTAGWYCEKQGVDKTDVFGKEQLDKIEMELIKTYGSLEGRARFAQEYHCSFDAALPGAYFGEEMNEAEARICGVPHNAGQLVFPAFDFGRGQSNSTAISFFQVVGQEPRVIDYYEDSTGNIEGYAKLLKGKPYNYGHLILPHDGGHDRLATGMSYAAQFQQFGFQTKIVPVTPSLMNDINITRQFIKMCWFDKIKTARLVDCLRNYHREWDEQNKVFKNSPKHNWAGHGVDSFRTGAVAHRMGYLAYDADNDYDEDYDIDMTSRNSISGY